MLLTGSPVIKIGKRYPLDNHMQTLGPQGNRSHAHVQLLYPKPGITNSTFPRKEVFQNKIRSLLHIEAWSSETFLCGYRLA
jgi:hypothetical protein